MDDEDSIALGPVPPELMALWIDVVGIMGADALESFVTRTRRSWSSAELEPLEAAVAARRRVCE